MPILGECRIAVTIQACVYDIGRQKEHSGLNHYTWGNKNIFNNLTLGQI